MARLLLCPIKGKMASNEIGDIATVAEGTVVDMLIYEVFLVEIGLVWQWNTLLLSGYGSPGPHIATPDNSPLYYKTRSPPQPAPGHRRGGGRVRRCESNERNPDRPGDRATRAL